jgi:topoisomerase-4 subunit A
MTADKKHQKALDGIMDIRDESDRNGVRAVIEFKKQIDLETAEKILLYLYKRCDLQININFNMVALYKGKPETMGLKDIIRYYVEHQREVVLRRTKKELDLAMKRFHIVEGFMKAIDIMDQVIKTIRESSSKTNARENLVKEYGFSEEQATAILELMLYRLTGLELKAYVKEHNELAKLIKSLEKVINSQKALDNLVKKELLEVSEDFGDERRTLIIKDEEEAVIDAMDIIVQEDVVVTISREGFIKRMPLKNYQRVTTDESSIDFREGDELAVLLESNTKDVLYIFSDSGMLYQLKTMDVPEHKWKDKGVRMDNYIKGIDFNEESIIGAFTMDGQEEGSFKFITSRGSLKRTDLESFKTNYSKIIALKLRKDEKLVSVILEKSRVLYENTLGELLPKVYKDYIYENKDQLHMVELPQVPLFVRILTKNGLDFTVPEADVEVKERMSIPDSFLSLPDKDEVYRVHYEMDYEAKAFNLTISDRGEIKVVQRASRSKNLYKVSGESYLSLVIVTSLGAYYKLAMYMFENLEGSVILSDLYDDIDKSERVVGVFTLEEDAADNQEVYFVTEEGIVKRTSVEDFRGEVTTSHVIKFKKATDRLVYAEAFSGELDEDILLVSEKGMAIRFETSSISLLSRNASGVVGMNLKDEDRVFFAKVITEEKELVVGSKANDDETMKIEEIKLQNRATRGKSIMMLVLGDKINKVEVN